MLPMRHAIGNNMFKITENRFHGFTLLRRRVFNEPGDIARLTLRPHRPLIKGVDVFGRPLGRTGRPLFKL